MGKGMVPCWQCGVEMPLEHSRCSRCGTPRPTTKLDEIQTTPGAPLIRVPKRRRISSHDLVPISLRDEYDEAERERAERGARSRDERAKKLLWAAAAGAALTALPMGIPGFLFLPLRSDAFLLAVLDVVIGALAGLLTVRVRGGLFQGLVLFGAGFAAAVATKIKNGYPTEHQPVAIAVLASAVVFSLLVAGFIGMALDEHED
jgi:hypothetical protein